MARAKTTSKASKGSKTTQAPAPARAKEAPGAPTAEGASEEGYSLAAAAKRLGAADPGLESAVRSAHPDDELQREGARVASERIVEDGQRLVSKALVHLESTDAAVKLAARKAGLTRPLLALTVDALGRLAATVSQMDLEQGKRSERKQVASHSIEAATNHARSLKRQTIERLKLVQGADPALAAAVSSASARAETPEQLAMQLTALTSIVSGLATHESPTVRALAEAKALDASDVAELTHAVEAIGLATTAPTNSTRREEKQAVLDVLDGLCLVLLDDLLRALRTMARATPKVRKPQLHGLAHYFGTRGKADEEPEAPPAPAPAPG